MQFEELIGRRRMVRAYAPDAVEDAALARILDRARRHPSAGFSQGIHFVVVTEDRQAIAEAVGEGEWVAKGYEPWLSAAPVHVVICAVPSEYHQRYAEPDKLAEPADWPVPYWWIDAGAALMLLLLAATDEGLAAGFMGAHAFTPGRLVEILGLPAGVEPVGVVTVGHGAQDPVVGSRNRVRKDIIHRERW